MNETGTCYDKPIWTLGGALRALAALPPQLARVAPSAFGRPIDGALRERVMLAVAAANRCRYCLTAHGVFGEAAGLDAEEIDALREYEDGRDDGRWDEPVALALRFVRDLARRDFQSRDEALAEALLDHYTPAERDAIEASAHVMNFANRFGNTFDAALCRLRPGACDATGASALDLALISGCFAAAAALAAPLVGLVGVANELRRRASA